MISARAPVWFAVLSCAGRDKRNSREAMMGPNRNPRASSPTTTSIRLLGVVGIVDETR